MGVSNLNKGYFTMEQEERLNEPTPKCAADMTRLNINGEAGHF